MEGPHSHASRTPRNFPPFPHAFKFSPAVGFSLAFHIIVIKSLTPCTDKKRGAHQWRRRRANFGDFGNALREGSGVDKDRLIETFSRLVVLATGKKMWIKAYTGFRAAMLTGDSFRECEMGGGRKVLELVIIGGIDSS